MSGEEIGDHFYLVRRVWRRGGGCDVDRRSRRPRLIGGGISHGCCGRSGGGNPCRSSLRKILFLHGCCGRLFPGDEREREITRVGECESGEDEVRVCERMGERHGERE